VACRAPHARESTAALTRRARIDNVVMMGMGEPLQNFAALVPALRTDARRPRLRPVAPARHGVAPRGVVPMIDRLREDCPVALAVSLHAPDDTLRERARAHRTASTRWPN
jgi:23S rRNA (adenine2503-C2)-methyltransferase